MPAQSRMTSRGQKKQFIRRILECDKHPIRTRAHQYEPSPLVIEASVILTLTTVIHSPDSKCNAMKARPSDAVDPDMLLQ
jgi:hypothetical protein